MLCFAYLTIFFCANTVIIHITPHLVDIGFSTSFAAIVIAIIGGTSIFGRVAMGITVDKIGSKRALLVCFIVFIVALSGLQMATTTLTLSIFGVVYGFCHGGFFALISPTVAEFFGTRYHGLILGIVIFSGSVGGAVGPLVTGHIFDTTDSYRTAFLLLLSLAITGFILILSSGPAKLKQ